MGVLASTRDAGHFNPLVPFAIACMRRGHDVVVCGSPSLANGPLTHLALCTSKQLDAGQALDKARRGIAGGQRDERG